ncbi:MAG: sigma-70 family RNA polymerase sigma factor [Alphaproteobacteria bacterium]|nr:sigma-70 family RNA polymerase sigma factor [Alphaproteobacteria bacterium]
MKKKTNQTIKAVSDDEFLAVLDKITKRLAHKFKFGYHSIEDMKQQAAIFALEGLKNYDHKRPLENFLWTHVRNRLFNYKRNNYQRPDKPCLTCPLYDAAYKVSNNQCSKFIDKKECEPYASWAKRNDAKKNIAKPSYFEDLNLASSPNGSHEHNEIVNFLDKNIRSEYRESYLKLKHNQKINKSDLNKLKKHIMEIMEENNWKTAEFPKNEDN